MRSRLQRSRFLALAVFGFLVSLAGQTAGAQNPFAGTWKVNQDLSQMAGDTLKFSPAEGEGMELMAGGMLYSFRVDGNPYAQPSGNVAIWRQISPASWTTEYRKRDGKLLASDDWKLSGDGKTLVVITSGVKATGELYTDTASYVRTAGTSGLMGGWKSTEVKMSSPNELGIQESGLDALLFKIPALKATCRATFDGKDAVVEGPDVPTGLRIALKRSGPYSFQLVQKLNGSVVSTSVYTVTEDGKTMTEVGGSPGDAPSSIVWEKQ